MATCRRSNLNATYVFNAIPQISRCDGFICRGLFHFTERPLEVGSLRRQRPVTR
jgi:hypothetical protein